MLFFSIHTVNRYISIKQVSKTYASTVVSTVASTVAHVKFYYDSQSIGSHNSKLLRPFICCMLARCEQNVIARIIYCEVGGHYETFASKRPLVGPKGNEMAKKWKFHYILLWHDSKCCWHHILFTFRPFPAKRMVRV